MQSASRSDSSHDSSEPESGIAQSQNGQDNADDTENECLFFAHTGHRNRNLITLTTSNRVLNTPSISCTTAKKCHSLRVSTEPTYRNIDGFRFLSTHEDWAVKEPNRPFTDTRPNS